MAMIYYEKDTDPGVLSDQKIAVLGFGSQGHAHAQNMQDSGLDVRVGLRAGSPSRKHAEEAGLRVLDVAEAVAEAAVVMCLLPDTAHGAVYSSEIAPNLKDGDMLMFAHGFSIHFGTVTPPEGVDVTMIAPKGPGHLVRRTYVEGNGTPGLVAVHQDATGKAKARALAYGAAIGCAKPGIIETTFKEETETDLFGEQTVLCGGVSELIRNGFETLVEDHPRLARASGTQLHQGGRAKSRNQAWCDRCQQRTLRPRRVVLRQLRDLLEQLRSTLVVEILRIELLLRSR